MSWAVFYVDASGTSDQAICPDWPAAHEVLQAMIRMINPPNTEVTFAALAKEAKPERAFHATDGVHSFAIESM